jgi:hypothetical protein
MNMKVNADQSIKQRFFLSETISEDKVNQKITEINSSGTARAFVEGNQLVVLQLFID